MVLQIGKHRVVKYPKHWFEMVFMPQEGGGGSGEEGRMLIMIIIGMVRSTLIMSISSFDINVNLLKVFCCLFSFDFQLILVCFMC